MHASVKSAATLVNGYDATKKLEAEVSQRPQTTRQICENISTGVAFENLLSDKVPQGKNYNTGRKFIIVSILYIVSLIRNGASSS